MTRLDDNKSDPNIETGTYGVFSTCELLMRKGVVESQTPYIFFVTNFDGERQLSGYYRVGWYALGKPMLGYKRGTTALADYSLAAREWKFVFPPTSLTKISKDAAEPSLTSWFRTFRSVNPVQAGKLLAALTPRRNANPEYVEEIHRLELVNKRFTGQKYVRWGLDDAFDWPVAHEYLSAPHGSMSPLEIAGTPVVRAGKPKYWECVACGHLVRSQSLRKRCEACHAIGTQRPSGARVGEASADDTS